MSRKGQSFVLVDDETEQELTAAACSTGLSKSEVLSAAVRLFSQAFSGVELDQPQVDGAPRNGEEMNQFIYDRALLSLSEACQFFDRSHHWFLRLEARGFWVTESGEPIAVYRDHRGKRWFSGSALYEMVHALYRAERITKPDMYLVMMRIMQQFDIERRRAIMFTLRQKKRLGRDGVTKAATNPESRARDEHRHVRGDS